MILEFSDWLFLINVEANASFSNEEASHHCTCTWCQNFYKTVDAAYPQLRYFLSRFGLDVDAPETLQPLTPRLYQAAYVAEGKILRQGGGPIFVGDLAITIEENVEPDTLILNVGLMNLPWVMDADPEQLELPVGTEDLFSNFKQ